MSGGVIEEREDRLARLALSGILMDLLGWSPWRAVRLSKACNAEQRAKIANAAKWPIRDQAAGSVYRLAVRAESDLGLPVGLELDRGACAPPLVKDGTL